MHIIANTKDGFLLQATEPEIRSIINASCGQAPEKIPIGTKIAALDYSASLTKLQGLKNSYEFRQTKDYINRFFKEFQLLTNHLENTKFP